MTRVAHNAPAATSSPLDRAGAVRPGEDLDTAAISQWLRDQGQRLTGSPNVSQFSGGASNWTYRLEYPEADLILRRPPKGDLPKSGHDMAREHRVQSALKPVYPETPDMIALCRDPAVLGCDFYVMRRIEGVIPRRRFPEGLAITPEAARALCDAMLDKLVALHAVDVSAIGLDDLGRGPGYARRQVEGWSRRYRRARAFPAPSFERVMAWLAERTPDDLSSALIHNDWRFDNLVLDPTTPERIVGVLDWEMATIGDPAMELGSMLAYWVESDDPALFRATQRQPTDAPGMMSRAEVVAGYCDRSGLKIDDWPFYEVFGLFRLAAILQQIYRRYQLKHTRNPMFRNLWLPIQYLNWRCAGLIKRAPS